MQGAVAPGEVEQGLAVPIACGHNPAHKNPMVSTGQYVVQPAVEVAQAAVDDGRPGTEMTGRELLERASGAAAVPGGEVLGDLPLVPVPAH